MKYSIKKYRWFFSSLLLGVLLWVLTYICIPAIALEALKPKTIIFIFFCYGALIFGFCATKFNNIKHLELDKSKVQFYIAVLIIIIIISYFIRWFELFHVRNLSFQNYPKDNRVLNELHFNKTTIIFIIASVLKSLYFFPYVMASKAKLKIFSWPVILSLFVLSFPIIEAILKGTRKPFLEIFIIILLTFIVYGNNKITITKISVFFIGIIIFMTISFATLIKRETKQTDSTSGFYSVMINSRYNDLLKPKPFVEEFFNKGNIPDILKRYVFISLQFGQYLAHGIYEFNHIIDDKTLPITYGQYTFGTIPKFINQLKLGHKTEIINPSPRQYVYLTAFGGFYIDFRWGTLFFIFILGIIQKFFYQKAMRGHIIYVPIFIYFLIINVFLPIINYMSGGGIYPFIAFSFFLIILWLLEKIIYEKSFNS